MPTSSEGSDTSRRGLLTVSGWVTLGAAAGTIGIGGGIFGLDELTGTGLALALLVCLAVVTVRFSHEPSTIVRSPERSRCFAGELVTVRLDATFTGAGRSTALHLRDAITVPGGHATSVALELAPIAPGETAHVHYSVTTQQRGIHSFGPLTVQRTDPFGLARRLETLPGTTDVIVRPRIDQIVPPTLDVDAESKAAAATTADGTELASLRAYVPGDDIRKVHWRTSARRDDLVVRQNHQPRRPGCAVVLDTRSHVSDEATFERMVSAAASILIAAAEAGQRVRLYTTDGFDSSHASARDHLDVTLTELSIIQPTPGSAKVRGTGRDPVVFVSTPAGVTDLASETTGFGRRLSVVIGGNGRTGDASNPADSIVVASDDRFDTVWNASFTARPTVSQGFHHARGVPS